MISDLAKWRLLKPKGPGWEAHTRGQRAQKTVRDQGSRHLSTQPERDVGGRRK